MSLPKHCRSAVEVQSFIWRHFLCVPSDVVAHLLSFLYRSCSFSVLTVLVMFLLIKPNTSALPIWGDPLCSVHSVCACLFVRLLPVISEINLK